MAEPFALIEAFRDTQRQLAENEELKRRTRRMQAGTRLYLDDFAAMNPAVKGGGADVSVVADTSFHCAQTLVRPGRRIAVLNFANAYSPGGGVKAGAAAQEECLCRCSNLYEALNIPYLFRHYYKWNQKNTGDMGSDRLIYSPGVTVFKSDDDLPENLPEWFETDVITCAAPYYNEGRKHPVTQDKLKEVFTDRIRNILEAAMDQDADVLVLGAFGCGVFNNPPQLVAGVFRKLLIDMNYAQYFEKVVFAIRPSRPGCPNLTAFEQCFE